MDQNKKYKPDDIINLRFYNEQTLPLSNGFKFLYNIDTFNWLLLVFIASNVGWMIPAFSQHTTEAICPDKNIQHWEKIDFKILSPEVAKILNVTDNTELNIKVLGNSNTIEDMKQKMVDFFQGKATLADKSAIEILGANYAVICAQ